MQIHFRAAALGLALLAPQAALACACGCGVFDVGASTMLPADTDTGFSVWFRYDYMNQNQNWEGSRQAPASDNGDKEIVTSFYTPGVEYMINRDWTIMAELPFFDRRLTTTDSNPGTVFGTNLVYTGQLFSQGDLQVSGLWTGLSPDLSTGLMFGMKFPTGDFAGPTGPLGGFEFDRDSLPGTGSTDFIFGAYHAGRISADGALSYFAQIRYQVAFESQDQYRPGNELDAAVAGIYDFGQVGPLSQVAPLLQLIVSHRDHDQGAAADPLNSGYTRSLVSTGVQVRYGKVRVYADAEWPIYQFTNAATNLAIEGTSGQLIASTLYKVQVAYDF